MQGLQPARFRNAQDQKRSFQDCLGFTRVQNLHLELHIILWFECGIESMEQMYCYVGDVLGFSDMVTALTLDEKKNLEPEQIAKFSPEVRASRVESWVQLVIRGLAEYKIPHYHFVSDTVFAGTEYTSDGLKSLLGFSKYLLEEGIKKSLPLRGGIAYGDAKWGR